MSTVLVPPQPLPVVVGEPPVFGFFPPVEGLPFPTNVLNLPQPPEVAAAIAQQSQKVFTQIKEFLFPEPETPPTPSKSTAASPPPSSPPPDKKRGRPATPDDFIKNKGTISASDLKTPLKIGATGIAVTGSLLGITAALDNAGKTVGDALSPILDPLGLGEQSSSIGKLVVLGLIVGGLALVTVMVLKKK